jgi:hypothetical protein
MVTFLIALWAWSFAGWVILAFLVGKGVIALEEFPDYGTEDVLLHFLAAVLLWPYTLWKASGDPGDDTDWLGEDDNPHF